MHLSEELALRAIPAAGVFLALTRRCPLTCAHCSTNSLMSSEEHDERIFLRFVETFTVDNRPEILLLTGGEPLLRPRLVQQLAELAHAVGTRVDLISGMFFARRPTVPERIARAIAAVDHFRASLDIYHEQQVPRAAVFRVLRDVLERGQDVSLQVVGLDETDPYLADVTSDIRRSFGDRVPVFVSHVGAVGRAKDWLPPRQRVVDVAPTPCAMAAWPVVAFDGTVTACCNQTVIDGPVPAHLRLGHAATDDWATIRERCLESPMVRALRVFGPEALVARHGSGKVACDGYCPTCYQLSDDPAIAEGVAPVMARPTMRAIEHEVTRLQQRALTLSLPRYAHLAELGRTAEGGARCAD